MDLPADRPLAVSNPKVTAAKSTYITSLTLALMTTSSVARLPETKDKAAQQKAQQLSHEFQQAGQLVPVHQGTITAAFAIDDGAICEDPASALEYENVFRS